MLSNSCSPDSLLTIFACAAADSQIFFKYIASLAKKDKTAKFIINMINRKRNGNIYKERMSLLAPYYLPNNKQLVGGRYNTIRRNGYNNFYSDEIITSDAIL